MFASVGDPDQTFTWAGATQTLDVDFSSASATINADDGVLAVFSFTLDAALAPGSEYEFRVDPAESFLNDPDGRPIPIESAPGRLRVRSPGTNPSLSIGAPKVHPGSGAELEIETAEPFALASGHLEIFYDPAIADGSRRVRTDPRHGAVATAVSSPAPGQVTIDFTSADGSLNARVPGALFTVLIPTKRSNAIGSQSWVQFGAGTFLIAPGPDPRPVNLPGDWLEFVSDPARLERRPSRADRSGPGAGASPDAPKASGVRGRAEARGTATRGAALSAPAGAAPSPPRSGSDRRSAPC